MSRENINEIIHMCWYCKIKESEKEPRGIYCKDCRIKMARKEIKSVLK